MKIILFGYGKMGHIIEEIAMSRGHEIVLKIDVDNRKDIKPEDLKVGDVAIEFTAPASAIDNINLCMDAGVPIVVGTTGWYEKLEEVKKNVSDKKGSLVYASNYSVGVNILFAMNKILAKWMNGYPDYHVEIEEVHHTEKLDSPSGTAISLADGIIVNMDRKEGWQKQSMEGQTPIEEELLKIVFDRKNDVSGIHKVRYTSEIDEIQISHEAFNRKGFAFGAVIAAEFIKNKKGIFTANDIFGF